MITSVNGVLCSFRVQSSPLLVFSPGDWYERGVIADWLAEGELPLGLVLRDAINWTVIEVDGELMIRHVKYDGTWRVLDADGVRNHKRMAKRRIQVLAEIYDCSMVEGVLPTTTELARRLGCVPGTISYHIGTLAADGLVNRSRRRAGGGVHLTEAGERLLGVCAAQAADD